MAGLNEIYDPRLNLAISRRLGMSSGPATTLAPEIQPSLDLGPMPELEFNLGWTRWQVGTIIAGVPANFSRAQFRMNDTADAIAIVEKIIVGCPTVNSQIVADLGYGPGVADLSTVFVQDFRDGRQSPAGASTAVISSGVAAAVIPAPAAAQLFVLAFQSAELPGAPWVLFKGNSILIETESANTNLLCTFVYRIRSLARGEQMPLRETGG